MSKYEPKQILNTEEFGFSFQAMPKKSMHFKDKKCADDKQSKVKQTGLAVGNVVGEKLPMFIIRKRV